MTTTTTGIWALLVGIRKYSNFELPEVSGADQDVLKVRRYLVDDLNVPPNNIVTLQDGDATRTQILSRFKEHLIDNNDIKPGDALVFHFSGHGGRVPAPPNWPTPDDAVSQQDGPAIEVFLPYDEGTEDGDGFEIPSIPDRTLAALLDDAAKAHGRNITVVLDCCSSGHGTRGCEDEGSQFVPRGVPSSLLSKLREDTDRHIWGSSEPLVGKGTGSEIRGLKASLYSMSHVLVAACDKTEAAQGNAAGGLFTKYWLQALKNVRISPRSYLEVVKAARSNMERFIQEKKLGFKQNPHCEGDACDRLVFQDLALDNMLFNCCEEGGRCKIGAGGVHGVKAGTVFDLYEVDPNTFKTGKVLGTAVACEVDPLECFADFAKNVDLKNLTFSARISQQAYPLKYALVNLEPESPPAEILHQLIKNSIGAMPQEISEIVTSVEDKDEADLVLEVNRENRLTLRRQDARLRDLSTRSPYLDDEEVRLADFPNILNAISRFNFFLAQTNENSPFSHNVSIKLHLLERNFTINYFGPDPLEKARALGREVPFEGDRFRLAGTDGEYAFVLRNDGNIPLFVFTTHFDSGTYEISNCYSPHDQEHAVLQPGGTLQLGASPERLEPFGFFIRDGDAVDTCFFKFYLLDSYTKMNFMDQTPQVGSDEYGEKYLRANRDNSAEAGIRIPPQKGQWDCVTRRIDIVAGAE